MSTAAHNTAELALLDELPEGWVETTLDQVLMSLESGSRPKGGVRGIKDGVASVGGEHLNESGGFRFNKVKYVPRKFYEQMQRGHIQVNDILVVKDGATTGKVALVRNDFPYNPAVVNEHVFICRAAEAIFPSFAFYYLFSKWGQDRILENFRGSAQGGINQSFASSTAIPLAPSAEQKRIVKKVEALLARVDAARERLANVPAILKRFRQGILAAAVTGQLTQGWRNGADSSESVLSLIERLVGPGAITVVPSDADPVEPPEIPDSWVRMRLEKLCRPERAITYGVIKLGGYVKDGVPTLRSSDVRWLYIDNYDVKRISHKIASNYSRTFLKGGEILVTVRGTLGGVAVAPADVQGFNISREVALIPILSELESFYFCYAIASIPSQNWLREVTKGVTYRGINIRDLKNLPLAVPPLAEQREIVCRVEALLKLADAIEKRVAAATIQADKLPQAILAKAFRGKLVPTEAELARREGHDYETAAQLLHRIKSERAAITESKPARAGRCRQTEPISQSTKRSVGMK